MNWEVRNGDDRRRQKDSRVRRGVGLGGVRKGDQARVLFMWVLTRLVHGMTQVDLDIARNLAEPKKADAGLQVWIDEVRRKATLTLNRTGVQRDY
jgi:hypothetical protein